MVIENLVENQLAAGFLFSHLMHTKNVVAGLMAGRQADEIILVLETLKFSKEQTWKH